MSYAWPYKIEVYSPNGDLLRRFARKAPFFDVQKKDSLGNLNYCGSSQQVAWLPDGNIINMTREWTGQGESRADMKNHLDLFDEKGTYLLTAASSDIFEPEDSFNVGELAADSQGNIWIVNNDPFPHIVKYKIEIVDLKK